MNGRLPENIFVVLPVAKRKGPFRLSEPMNPQQIARLRAATPAEKFAQIAAMRDNAVELQKIGLRMRHPEWSEAEIESEARLRIMYART